MSQTRIFQNDKIRQEFLDRFEELKESLFIPQIPLLPANEGFESMQAADSFTVDDAKKAVETVEQEGSFDNVPVGFEAIILRFGRPAYFVQKNSFDTRSTPSTSEEVDATVEKYRKVIETAIPKVGRINLQHHRMPWVGTGWIVAENILVTNRHVASVFATRDGEAFVFIKSGTRATKATLDTLWEHEQDDEIVYELKKVLWIAPPDVAHDVAFLSIEPASKAGQKQPAPITLMKRADFDDLPVEGWLAVIGYPAWSPFNSAADQQRIFDGVFDVKRLQPGLLMSKKKGGLVHHDASTLGGNSGSVVLDLESGQAVALHFGGTEGERNSSVAAPLVAELLEKHVLDNRTGAGTSASHSKPKPEQPPEQPDSAPDSQSSTPVKSDQSPGTSGAYTWTIPLQVSITVGAPAAPVATTTHTTLLTSPPASTREGRFGTQEPQLSDELIGSFSAASLSETAFSWKTALATALASWLSYAERATVHRWALDRWGLEQCEVLDMGTVQCFTAVSSEVILISFRGTDRVGDWLTNLNVRTVQKDYGRVHRGFSLAFQIVQPDLEAILATFSDKPVLLTGHSLGGALATIAAAEWQPQGRVSGIYTFGQPAVGKDDFRDFMQSEYGSTFFRFVNDDDIVPRVPPRYSHVGRLFHFGSDGGLESLTETVDQGTADEPPRLNDVEFQQLKAQLQATLTATPLESPVIQEGLFPSLRDHSMVRYVQKVAQRQ